jgi:uncharacterized protein YijF (DUF1287 family)
MRCLKIPQLATLGEVVESLSKQNGRLVVTKDWCSAHAADIVTIRLERSIAILKSPFIKSKEALMTENGTANL